MRGFASLSATRPGNLEKTDDMPSGRSPPSGFSKHAARADRRVRTTMSEMLPASMLLKWPDSARDSSSSSA